MSDENMLFATEDEQEEMEKKDLNEVATRKFLTSQTDNLQFGID